MVINMMNQFKLEHSPIVYYISGKAHREWVLFLHAAFVNYKMFRAQTEYFRNKYNVFAKANKKISTHTSQAQNDFYKMNVRFPKKSFRYLVSLNSMVNKFQTTKRAYPLLIGCGEFDIPMELKAVEMWKKSEPECEVSVFKNVGHCVNMDVPQEFNTALEEFWG